MDWVTADKLDAKKISVSTTPTVEGSERYKILYKYSPDSDPRDLVLSVAKTPDAYIKCRGVQKDFFTRGETRVQTNRYGAQFILNTENEYHNALYDALLVLKRTVEKLTASSASFPMTDRDKTSILYTKLIHANDGRMFSSAYTTDQQLTIVECTKPCIVRPAFLISLLKKSPGEVKINVQLSQMYVHEIVKEFPLAHID